MTYEIEFTDAALDEWRELDNSVKLRLKKALIKRQEVPRVPKDAMNSMNDCYKIKIVTPQFRLIYHVDDTSKVITVLIIGPRDTVYLKGIDIQLNH